MTELHGGRGLSWCLWPPPAFLGLLSIVVLGMVIFLLRVLANKSSESESLAGGLLEAPYRYVKDNTGWNRTWTTILIVAIYAVLGILYLVIASNISYGSI